MRLIDADELKKAIEQWFVKVRYYQPNSKSDKMPKSEVFDAIDNAPTVEITEEQAIDKLHETGWLPEHDRQMTERPQGEWIDFAQWVAKEVLDDYFEDCSGAFAEIACRKLVKLGLVEVEGDVYKMKGGAE